MYTQVKYLPEPVVPHIVCHRTANLEQFDMPHIHALANEPKWRWYWEKGLRKLGVRRYISLLTRVAAREGAGIIHSHFGPYGWEDMEAARKLGAKHVVTFYGADVNKLPKQDPRWLDRYSRLFEHVSLVLCEGPHMGKCVEKLGCPAEKIRVQHLGIELDKHVFAPRSWQPGTPLRVLIASSFREKKGIPYGIEALAKLKAKVPIEVTLIGDAGKEATSQAEKKKILDAIEKNNLGNDVKLLGYQSYDRLIEEARTHHVYLAPSVTASDGDTEGGAPVSIIEMMASGMPVVSTYHCDIPHIVTHQETGLLAEERDVDGLFAGLLWLVENPDQWERLIQAARAWIEKAYDARVQGEQLAGLYQMLVSSNEAVLSAH